MEKVATKYLRVRMSDGSDYDIPANRVADHFANAQASKECRGVKESLEKLYSVYFELAMTSDMELMEWASTKMTWKDLSSYARLVKVAETPHHEKDWEKATKRVVVY